MTTHPTRTVDMPYSALRRLPRGQPGALDNLRGGAYNSNCLDEQNTGALCFSEAVAVLPQSDIAGKVPSTCGLRSPAVRLGNDGARGGLFAMSIQHLPIQIHEEDSGIVCPKCSSRSVKLDRTTPGVLGPNDVNIQFRCRGCHFSWNIEIAELGNITRVLPYCEPRRPVYKDYIQSEEWKAKAARAKERAGYRCQLCNKDGDATTLHAHHRTYENLGNESMGDITVLCSDCHAKFHGK